MGKKHKPFREFRTPFPLRDIRENSRSNVRACAAGDGAIRSKNRKIVPYAWRQRNFPFRKQAMPFSQHLENFSTNFSLLN